MGIHFKLILIVLLQVVLHQHHHNPTLLTLVRLTTVGLLELGHKRPPAVLSRPYLSPLILPVLPGFQYPAVS